MDTNKLNLMKKQKEEIQSRRDFFKKAAKTALPILGVALLASNPIVAKATENLSTYCDHCNSNCTNGCKTGCQRSCRNTCAEHCEGNTRKVGPASCGWCDGLCAGCSGQCSGQCSGSCAGGSYTVM